MRQIIILIISLGILLFSGIWEIKYLEKTSRYALSDVEYSKNAIENGNFKLANEHIDAINNTWNDIKPVWNIFVVHEEIDSIEDLLVQYKVYVEHENKEEALACSNTLSRTLAHVIEKQKLSFENVF